MLVSFSDSPLLYGSGALTLFDCSESVFDCFFFLASWVLYIHSWYPVAFSAALTCSRHHNLVIGGGNKLLNPVNKGSYYRPFMLMMMIWVKVQILVCMCGLSDIWCYRHHWHGYMMCRGREVIPPSSGPVVNLMFGCWYVLKIPQYCTRGWGRMCRRHSDTTPKAGEEQ